MAVMAVWRAYHTSLPIIINITSVYFRQPLVGGWMMLKGSCKKLKEPTLTPSPHAP